MKDEQNESAAAAAAQNSKGERGRQRDERAEAERPMKKRTTREKNRSTTLFCVIANWLQELSLTQFLWFLVANLLHLLYRLYVKYVRFAVKKGNTSSNDLK